MPNHVTTCCTITGDANEICRFIDTCIKEDHDGRFLNFNTVIPMPDVLKGTEAGSEAYLGASLIMISADKYSSDETVLAPDNVARIRKSVCMPTESLPFVARKYLDKNPSTKEKGERCIRAVLETGFRDWYDWSIVNWGTKWNSYYFSISPDPDMNPQLELEQSPTIEIRFDTAWSFPEPVFRAIADTFPSLSFYCVCYDEGGGFAGVGYFNPPEGEDDFTICDATADLYEAVYGEPPEYEDDEDDEEIS